MEYPELLDELEKVEHNVEREMSHWDKFNAKREEASQRIHNSNIEKIRMGQPSQDDPPDIIPAEAVSNMLATPPTAQTS